MLPHPVNINFKKYDNLKIITCREKFEHGFLRSQASREVPGLGGIFTDDWEREGLQYHQGEHVKEDLHHYVREGYGDCNQNMKELQNTILCKI